MATKAIAWTTNYRAVFGAINDNQANAWMDYLNSNLENGLQANELDRAVAELCDTWPSDSKRHPGVRDILAAIKTKRLRTRGIDTSKPFLVRQAESQLHRAPADTLERWEIICRIAQDRYAGRLDRDWAPHVEAYAARLGPLVVPYWAASESRVAAGARVVDRESYIASLPDDQSALYREMSGLSFARLAGAKKCVLVEQ